MEMTTEILFRGHSTALSINKNRFKKIHHDIIKYIKQMQSCDIKEIKDRNSKIISFEVRSQ